MTLLKGGGSNDFPFFVMQVDDIALWPNGDWCWGNDLDEYLTFHSDDYEIIVVGTTKWVELTNDEENY